jgi:hypothetical protein
MALSADFGFCNLTYVSLVDVCRLCWASCMSLCCSGEVTVEIPESLPTATMLNQNTDTYNDYLGEQPVKPLAEDANGVKSQFPVLMLSYCAPLFEYILHFMQCE